MKPFLTMLFAAILVLGLHNSLLAQAPVNLLFENFDGTSGATHVVPASWTVTTNRLAAGDWWDTTLTGNSAPNICYNINSTIEQIITTPVVDFTGYIADSVILYARRSSTYNAINSVEFSTNGGSSWTVIDTLSGAIPTSSFKRYAFKIPSAADGQASVTFRYRNQGNGTGSAGTNRLDDFTVRGVSASLNDGDGTASISNNSGGTLNGTTIFNRNSSSQTVVVTITGTSTGTLDKVKLTVPGTWSGYSSSNVTLGGAFSGKTNSGSGNDIQINSAALGTTPGTITITTLTSPNPNTAGN